MKEQPLLMDYCTEKVIRHYSNLVYRLDFYRTGSKITLMMFFKRFSSPCEKKSCI